MLTQLNEWLVLAAQFGHISTAVLVLERGANYDSRDRVSLAIFRDVCIMLHASGW